MAVRGLVLHFMAQASNKKKMELLTRLMSRGRRWEAKRANELAASMQMQQQEKQIWVRQWGRRTSALSLS